MLESTFILTALLILLPPIIAVVLKRSSVDRCLKDFHKFHVTMEMKGGKKVWGFLNVATTGLEFLYSNPHRDGQGHTETSFIFYENEYPQVQTFIRYHSQLTPDDHRARKAALDRVYRKPFWQRTKRTFRNYVNTLKDAILKILDFSLTQMRARSPVLAAQSAQISALGKEVIGYAGSSYDPILERLIGSRVVLEITKDGKTYDEYVGVLKDYSATFVEVLDIEYPAAASATGLVEKADIIVPRSHSFIRHRAGDEKLV
jgi:small nuclear ribonucleoprotein (snRNP)-like protein